MAGNEHMAAYISPNSTFSQAENVNKFVTEVACRFPREVFTEFTISHLIRFKEETYYSPQ